MHRNECDEYIADFITIGNIANWLLCLLRGRKAFGFRTLANEKLIAEVTSILFFFLRCNIHRNRGVPYIVIMAISLSDVIFNEFSIFDGIVYSYLRLTFIARWLAAFWLVLKRLRDFNFLCNSNEIEIIYNISGFAGVPRNPLEWSRSGRIKNFFNQANDRN